MLDSGEHVERPPTTTELFTHLSGLRNDDSPGGRPWFAQWTHGETLAHVVVRYASEFPFKSQPGERYAYSGIGTDVAARALEVASGTARNQLIVDGLAEPLGMKNTFYRDARSLEQLGTMPTRYRRGDDGKLVPDRKRPIPPTDTYSSSGGSIISTAPDLAQWLLMIRNRGQHGGEVFLEPHLVAEMLSPCPPSRNARGGMFVRKKNGAGEVMIIGHTGSSGTNCWIDFELDLIGIMLTQTRGKDIKPFRIELERRVARIVGTRDEHDASGEGTR